MGTSVVRRSDGAETLLAGGIPLQFCQHMDVLCSLECTHDLQLHGLAVQLDGSDFLYSGQRVFMTRLQETATLQGDTYEIDTDGGDVALGVGIIGETEQQA